MAVFFNILYMLSQRYVQNKGYCPGYFKIVRISGKIRSFVLLTERYPSSECHSCRHLRCRDACHVKLDLSSSGLGRYFRILVTVKISVSLTR
jgi:hypothetical protein